MFGRENCLKPRVENFKPLINIPVIGGFMNVNLTYFSCPTKDSSPEPIIMNVFSNNICEIELPEIVCYDIFTKDGDIIRLNYDKATGTLNDGFLFKHKFNYKYEMEELGDDIIEVNNVLYERDMCPEVKEPINPFEISKRNLAQKFKSTFKFMIYTNEDYSQVTNSIFLYIEYDVNTNETTLYDGYAISPSDISFKDE